MVIQPTLDVHVHSLKVWSKCDLCFIIFTCCHCVLYVNASTSLIFLVYNLWIEFHVQFMSRMNTNYFFWFKIVHSFFIDVLIIIWYPGVNKGGILNNYPCPSGRSNLKYLGKCSLAFYFWPQLYPTGSLIIALVRSWSVFNYSQTAH